MKEQNQQEVSFRFDFYSKWRKEARVYINQGDGESWLWMSKNDIEENIREFGEHPELLKALKIIKQENK